jgi:hypothetical protein
MSSDAFSTAASWSVCTEFLADEYFRFHTTYCSSVSSRYASARVRRPASEYSSMWHFVLVRQAVPLSLESLSNITLKHRDEKIMIYLFQQNLKVENISMWNSQLWRKVHSRIAAIVQICCTTLRLTLSWHGYVLINGKCSVKHRRFSSHVKTIIEPVSSFAEEK